MREFETARIASILMREFETREIEHARIIDRTNLRLSKVGFLTTPPAGMVASSNQRRNT